MLLTIEEIVSTNILKLKDPSLPAKNEVYHCYYPIGSDFDHNGQPN